MAAGRGHFYQNVADGLLKTAVLQPQSLGRGKPGSRGNKKRRNKASQKSHRCISSTVPTPAPTYDLKKLDKSTFKNPQTNKNVFERLPSEVLLKILSYLDATSLYYLSHVNKLFFHLANDDFLWYTIYISQFGVTQSWWINYPRPRVTQGRSLTSFWKQKYVKALAGQELVKWRHELRDINPYTGLPRQTEWVLRNLNVCWKLSAKDGFGQEVILEPSKVYFFETSVILRWSSESLPCFSQIRNLELHGLRKEMHIVKKPLWHSLMLRWDLHVRHMIGKDRLIKLLFLSPGFIVGIWRGQDVIAFIMVCLHFHRLLERSLCGSPVSPYMEPTVRLPRDWSDSKCGLHGYNLHFVLHNTGAEIMSEYFPDLSCRPVAHRLMALGVIYKSNLSRHHSLSGNIRLPWKTEKLEGSIENCCFMTLTLLDDFQKPFWCLCTPITITRSKKSLSFDYSGEHYLMNYYHPEGQVKMKLVWLQEEKQFFLIDLTIFVPTDKVNRYFCTKY